MSYCSSRQAGFSLQKSIVGLQLLLIGFGDETFEHAPQVDFKFRALFLHMPLLYAVDKACLDKAYEFSRDVSVANGKLAILLSFYSFCWFSIVQSNKSS